MSGSEAQILEDFSKSASTYFSERVEYDSVNVLLTFWKENDLNPDKEIDALQTVFEQNYKFHVTRFPIPSQGAQPRLNREVANFVALHADHERTLIILYYAGHCFKGPKEEARWAAFEKGGPTLSWSACQQNLFGALGDVLLVLDCCNAALLAKGTKEQGRFEVLAASAKGVLTPEPGKYSFTAFLLRELRRHAESGVTVSNLASLLSENERITATPCHLDLARTSPTSTLLKRLKDLQHVGFMKKPAGFLVFRASLTDDLTGRQIADWLKTAPPESVTAVNIEAVVLKARRLQGQLDSKAFPAGSLLGKLSSAAQQGILRELQGLNSVMSNTTELAQDPLMQADEQSIIDAYRSIETRISAVCDAVETPVLLDLDPKNLNMRSGENALLDATGTTEAASLRDFLISNQTISAKLELDFHRVRDLDSLERFGTGRIENRLVLTEFFDYYPDPDTGEPYCETVQQLERMAQVLCHSKRPSYHILPCVGYVHDKFARKFGLVFEPPFQSNLDKGPVAMLQLFDREPIVPLGHRVRLAHALCAALESFHRVGWVHKEIRSSNVAFLPFAPSAPEQSATAPLGDLDVAYPWLFGFEYARAEAAGTRREEDHSIDNNLYRHPDRWGRPLVDFSKAHDVYALGVVLYEIAIWKRIKAILKVQGRQRIPSDYVKTHIEKACKRKVPHQVGEVLASAIRVCIGFEQETKGMDQYQAQSFFQKKVVERLQKIVGRI